LQVGRYLAGTAWPCCCIELRSFLNSAGGHGFCRIGCRFLLSICSCTIAFARLGGFHAQRVIEAVEVVEETDGAQQFDDFTVVVEGFQFGELLVAEAVGVEGDGFGEADGGLFCRGEVFAGLPRR